MRINNHSFFSFQVFKISNVDVKDSAIYMVEHTLYNLLQNEDGIMAAATSMKADECERKFMEIVNEATEDYGSFLNQVFDDVDMLKIELMTNFKEFFEICLNIKKTELESGTQTPNSIDASGPSGISGSSPATSTSSTSALEEKQSSTKAPKPSKSQKK